MIMYT